MTNQKSKMNLRGESVSFALDVCIRQKGELCIFTCHFDFFTSDF